MYPSLNLLVIFFFKQLHLSSHLFPPFQHVAPVQMKQQGHRAFPSPAIHVLRDFFLGGVHALLRNTTTFPHSDTLSAESHVLALLSLSINTT